MSKGMVHGVGINDADYQVQIYEKVTLEDGTIYKRNVWCCPFYRKWRSMLERCYSDKWLAKYPSYVGCYVCNEWKYFSNFKSWMETQKWEGKQLDKDLLVRGNKVYSPDTCCFITQALNKFMTEVQRKESDYPTGVTKASGRSKRYTAQCYDGCNNQTNLGNFLTVEEAEVAYKTFKLSVARRLAGEIEDKRIANALIDRYTF